MSKLTEVRCKMEKFGLSAIFVDDPINITYLTGLKVSRGVVVVSKDRAWVLLDSRYNAAPSQLSDEWTAVLADAKNERDQLLEMELMACGPVVGFDGMSVSFRQAEYIRNLCVPSCSFGDAKDFFPMLRRPKNATEIAKLEDSCRLCSAGFEYILTKIREGISEKELSLELTLFWLKEGGDSLSFDPIIAFGANSACPHWKPSTCKLLPNSVVLIDIGVQLDGYQSDMTRVVFFGEVSPHLKKCAAYVEEAYNIAAAAAVPSVVPFNLDDMVRKYFASIGLKSAFLHGLGHGVGLQIHEPPRLNPNNSNEPPLMKGDIITIEPGLYFEGQGGIRLENTCLVTDRGAISLMTVPLSPVQL